MAKRGTHKPRVLTVKVAANVTPAMYDWLIKEAGQEHTISGVVRMALEQYRAYVEAEMAEAEA